jgi:predicted transposase/invertase (TIGR01784 family)
MKKKIQNQHDKIVKETFSRPEIAKEYFKQFLPESLRNVIDIDSMVKLDTSYIQDGQDEYFSDLVFQFKVKSSHKELMVSLLFEHKANPDKYAHIQIGHYIFSQWVREIKDRVEIVPIIPFIYYQGKKEWKVPTLYELFDEYPQEIKKYIPIFDFVFMAINALSDQTLDAITDVMLLIALAGHDPNVDFKAFAERLKRILALKKFDDVERNFITLFFVYKLNNTEIDTAEVISIIESLPNPINKEFMSTYDAIKIEGKLEGKLEGKIEMILSLYEDKLPISQIAKYANLSEDEVIKILKNKSIN